MIDIDNKIVHFDVFKEKFCCDLKKCKGICCIEGDIGAVITTEEKEELEKKIDQILPFLTDEAQKEIKENGIDILDFENEYTTNLCEDGVCVFGRYDEEGILYCVLEKLYEKNIINFRKPISCYLYPIRIKKFNNLEAVNYDRWKICKDAVIKGKEENITVLDFLKEPLIIKYGEEWYKEAKIAQEYLKDYER